MVAYDNTLSDKELVALLKESDLNPNDYLIDNEWTALAALKKIRVKWAIASALYEMV